MTTPPDSKPSDRRARLEEIEKSWVTHGINDYSTWLITELRAAWDREDKLVEMLKPRCMCWEASDPRHVRNPCEVCRALEEHRKASENE